MFDPEACVDFFSVHVGKRWGLFIRILENNTEVYVVIRNKNCTNSLEAITGEEKNSKRNIK